MRIWKYLFTALMFTAISIWLAVFTSKDRNFHLIACDVGQGDAILAIYGSTQVLIDGGPDNSVLSCLENYVPFWDREIELVVLTHPQLDHYGGLVEVLSRYKVGTFLTNSFETSTQGLKALENAMGGAEMEVLRPDVGTQLRVGMIYLDIHHPPRGEFSEDLNNISIVTVIRFEDFVALLTGDIENEIANQIAQKNLVKEVDYIKIPHHGSKNGLTRALLEVSRPQIAVISAGKNNSYGHPHQEILQMLADFGVEVFRTDKDGNIEVVSNGKEWFVRQ